MTNELGSVISCATKSSCGAVIFTIPFVVPVAVILLFERSELNRKSETSLLFPPWPIAALALMKLAALRKIIQEQAGKTEKQTNEYVEKLKSDKRYKRDVY